MSHKNIGGHSGCQVILIEENEGNFVRKISKNIEYNTRLKEQCIKQKKFKSYKLKSPRILSEGYTENGLYYFDMEYIQGETLSEYIRKVDMNKLKNIVDSVTEQFSIKRNILNENVQEIFSSKILELRKNPLVIRRHILNEALNELENHDWNNFSSSNCHGDYTLENIIVKNDELYLIDFLDSFFDSWLIDAGKILQDVQVLWAYRNLEMIDTNTIVRLIVFRDLLLAKVENINSNLIKEIYYALLLHLIRIYPYTYDSFTQKFLDKKVSIVLNKLKGNNIQNENVNYSMLWQK